MEKRGEFALKFGARECVKMKDQSALDSAIRRVGGEKSFIACKKKKGWGQGERKKQELGQTPTAPKVGK